MRTVLAALTTVAAVAGCNVDTPCDSGSYCTSGFSVSLYEANGAPMPDGLWVATVTVGSTKKQIGGTIDGGQLVSGGMSDVELDGRVQELFFTVEGTPSTVQVSVTHDTPAVVASQTFDGITYQSTSDGCGGTCRVGAGKLPLP